MDVKQIRLQALMTQHEFAKELGLAVGTIAKWEVGITQPSVTNKRKIVEFCKKNNISVRY